jgi:hypothetical protein
MNRRRRNISVGIFALRTVFAVIFLLISCALVSAQTHDEWIKYDSKEGRYSVLLPSQPTVDSQEATSTSGNKFTQYKATVTGANVVYMIGYFDYSPPTTFTLEKGRDGMVNAVKGTLLTERAISLGGAPGREIHVGAKDESGLEFVIFARFYDIDHRVYVVQFITTKAGEATADMKANKYFDSFQVVKAP